MSGEIFSRASAMLLMMRSLPLLWWGSKVPDVSTMNCTLPAMVSVMAPALPA
jgi:hypothetical protein